MKFIAILFASMIIQEPHLAVETNIDELRRAIGEAMAKGDTAHAITLAELGVQAQIQIHGKNNIDVSRVMMDLCGLYMISQRFEDADRLARQGLGIVEKTAGSEHKLCGAFLTVISDINCKKKAYSEAESLALKALDILDKALGTDSKESIMTLGVLEKSLNSQKKFSEGEAALKKILIIFDKNDWKDSPEVLPYLKDLLRVYLVTRRFQEAEPIQRRILSIQEKCRKPDDLLLADECEFLSQIIDELPKTEKSEVASEIYRLRALDIREKNYGPEHVSLLPLLEYLANLAIQRNNFIEMDIYYNRVIAIREKAHGQDDPDLIVPLKALGLLYSIQKRYDEADLLYRKALSILEKKQGSGHVDLLRVLDALVETNKALGRTKEANEFQERANKIRAKTSSPQKK